MRERYVSDPNVPRGKNAGVSGWHASISSEHEPMMTPSCSVGDTHIEIVTLLLVGRSGPPWRSAAPIDAQDSQRMRDIIVAHGGAAFESDDGTLGGAFESAAAALDAALSIRQGGPAVVERQPEAVP